MNTFAKAVATQKTTTTNGMVAYQGTGNDCLDLFYSAGSSRGNSPQLLSKLNAAFQENAELATRIVLWLRDIRGGAGERQLFRDGLVSILNDLPPTQVARIINLIPEIGRWDDLFIFVGTLYQSAAFDLIEEGLREGNGLCAKWMPRKGSNAELLRAHLELTPKQYRKTLVNLTKVVETQMCAQDWDSIEFGKIPSVAHARYKTAFYRNALEKYEAYKAGLVKGTEKINAGAIFPYDVLKGVTRYSNNHAVVDAQWEALPDMLGDQKIIPMVDVSGSMTWFQVAKGVNGLDVAVSLGLYTATKLKGAFKDLFLTFSSLPELVKLKGDSITTKAIQMQNSSWGGSTNIESALKLILKTAKDGKVSQADMPEYLVIFSDMQFDQCNSGRGDQTFMKMMKKEYKKEGYEAPKVVFWNLAGNTKNVPAKAGKEGVAMVSGFSPNLMKSVFSGKQFDPVSIMLETVMVDRYNVFE